MSYNPPPGERVRLDIRLARLAVPGGRVPLAFVRGGALNPALHPARLDAAAAANWGRSSSPRHAMRLICNSEADFKRASLVAPWVRAPQSSIIAGALRWGDIRSLQICPDLQWHISIDNPHAQAQIRWDLMPTGRVAGELIWSGNLPRCDYSTSIAWQLPQMQPQGAKLKWRRSPCSDAGAALPWANPPMHAIRPVLPWGMAAALHWFIGSPGPVPPAPSPPWAYIPPPGRGVALDFRCPRIAPPGSNVPLPIGRGGCYLAWPTPRRYIVLNTVAVVRLPERTPIPVTSGSIRSARDKSTRDIALTLADPGALDLLRPGPDGPKSVEINVNGHVFAGIIESWDDNRRHLRDGGSGRAVSVSGRSRAALLAEPYAPRRARIEPNDRQAQQLIDAELELTGFVADVPAGWSWLVPGGTWAYDGKTRLDAIDTIAQAAGGVVIAHPWDDALRIRPLYPVSPWDWPATAPDVHVHDDLILEHTRSAGTGARGSESVVIPLWPPAAADRPRLVEPLDLVELVEPAPRKLQAAAVEITFAMQSSGNGAHVLTVEQRITLDPAPPAPVYNNVLVSGAHIGVSDPVIRAGTAGDVRLPSIIDPLITDHSVARERGRNALAAGASHRAASNLWRALRGLDPAPPARKGIVVSLHPDGSYSVATADGATIRARPMPGAEWQTGEGVMIRDGTITDSAPALPGVVQYV